jgi:nitrogen regulatory protein PII
MPPGAQGTCNASPTCAMPDTLLDTFPKAWITSGFAPGTARSRFHCGGYRPSGLKIALPFPPGGQVQLLIAVINEEEKLDEILSGMIELGITGATIIGSEGMGRVLSHDIPIFAGLEKIALLSRPRNQTIFSVIREDEKVAGVLRLFREILGDLESPATGIVFTVPINQAVGLAPEIGEPGAGG